MTILQTIQRTVVDVNAASLQCLTLTFHISYRVKAGLDTLTSTSLESRSSVSESSNLFSRDYPHWCTTTKHSEPPTIIRYYDQPELRDPYLDIYRKFLLPFLDIYRKFPLPS